MKNNDLRLSSKFLFQISSYNIKLKYPVCMKKVYILTIVFFLFYFKGITQELPQLAPVSPNSASLARFGSYAVNTNLGRANITVPIYTLKIGDLQLPISLDYNSSGIRLNDRASWVGLGWNLQAGGAIIRNIKGIPDGYGNTRENITNLEFNENNFNYLYDVFRGFDDDKPDKYILNAFGINASFYFIERNGIEEIVFENNNSIKITSTGSPYYGFHVIVEDGTELLFNDSEISKLPPPTAYMSYHRDATTSYYLTEIVSSNKKDTIHFEYKTHKSFEIPVETSSAMDFNHGGFIKLLLNNNLWNNRVEIDKKYLDKIVFNNGYIKFESLLDRIDLTQEYRLDNLKVYSKTSVGTEKLIKEIHLEHSYYIRGSEPEPNNFDKLAKVKSLKLESLTIGALVNIDSQKFKFEYDEQSLPSRGSYKQDFWGYINSNSSQTLIPPTTFTTHQADYVPEFNTHSAGDADRNADPIKMKSGILTKIIYPTGGFTEFEFEANQYEVTENTPTYITKSKNIQGIGSGDCNGCFSNGKQSLTFSIDENPLGPPSDGMLTIAFTDAYSGAGRNSYGSFNGTKYYRDISSDGYPYTIHSIPIQLSTFWSHTIEAEEFGHGSNPPSNVPSVSVIVSWKEKTGSSSIAETKYIGGLRIKSIKNYDGITLLPVSVKNYTYDFPNVINPQKEGFVKKYVGSPNMLKAILSSTPYFENGIDLLPAIEYGIVTEYDTNTNGIDIGKKVYTYENISVERDLEDTREIYKHPLFDISSFTPHTTFGSIMYEVMYNEDIADNIIKPYNHGSIKKIEFFNNDTIINEETIYKLIREEVYDYKTVDESSFKLNYIYSLWPPNNWNTSVDPYGETSDMNSLNFYFKTRKVYLGKKLLTSKIERQYGTNGENSIEIITSFKYNSDYLLKEKQITNSKGNKSIYKTYYPDDITSKSTLYGSPITDLEKIAIDKLKKANLHQITIPIQVDTYQDLDEDGIADSNELLSIQRTNYKDRGGDIVLPESIETLKGVYNASNNTLMNRIIYNDYYANGNVKEVYKADGVHIVYIWGYNEEYPIAKLENAKTIDFTPDQNNKILAVKSASDIDSNTTTEDTLRTKLESLRAVFSNAMVTTYTYDPLVGVTSITDTRGETIYYEYDDFNRLKNIKNSDGHILSENEYHYKGE